MATRPEALSRADHFLMHIETALAWEAEPEDVAGERWTLALAQGG